MTPYQLSIITPNGKIFEGSVELLSLPGYEGSLGILAHHAPMITRIKRGILKLIQNQTEQWFAISSGILEVDHRNQVMLLSDEVIQAKDGDDAKAIAKDLANT